MLLTLFLSVLGFHQKLGDGFWNLDIADGKMNDIYSYEFTGKGVNVYIIDSGVEVNHPEFQGRAKLIWKSAEVTDDLNDSNGHGTHVAGIIGGKTTGIAKGTNLLALRVFGNKESIDASQVEAAFDFLETNIQKPAVINLSIGGNKSLENLSSKIVSFSQKHQVPIVVSAGNDGLNNCGSLTRLKNTISIGSLNSNTQISTFSNYGKCVDFYAPGEEIKVLKN